MGQRWYLRSDFVLQGRDTQSENTLASRFGPVMPDMELQPSAGSSGCLTVVRPMVLVTAVRLLHPGLVQGSSKMATKRENGAKASNLLPGRARIGPPSYLMYSGSGGREEAPRSGGALSLFLSRVQLLSPVDCVSRRDQPPRAGPSRPSRVNCWQPRVLVPSPRNITGFILRRSAGGDGQ